MISVKLFANLREGLGKEISIQYVEGIKVIDIVNQLGIESEEVSIILINGVHQNLDTVLLDKDKLQLFPPVGGG